LLAPLHRLLGDLDAAAASAERAAEVAAALGSPYMDMVALLNQVEIAIARSDPRLAAVLVARATRLASTFGVPDAVLKCRLLDGRIRRSLGDREGAEECFRAMLAAAEAAGSWAGRGAAAAQLADLYEDVGRRRAAAHMRRIVDDPVTADH
ncbi:MAG TPA: hypothetical protein VGD67_28670, partial [Pseudonocardiaceae bacterium]